MNFQLTIEKTAKALLGEGPLWDDRENVLYFVDIEGQSIRKYDPVGGQEWVLPTPQRVGTIGLCKDGRMLAALEDGIYFLSQNEFILAHDPCPIEGFRFNDGKVGPDGRFYAGTMSQTGEGAFYRLDPDRTLTRLFGGVSTSNGLDWSSDAKTLYYNDTHDQRTDAFDFDVKRGTVSNRRTVYDYSDERPDGMCIDEHGNLYVALWGSNKVSIIDPNTHKAVGEIKTPALQTSCTTFGGSDLGTLYITSACVGRLGDAKDILAGSLFSVKMSVKGVKANLFG
ncbi:MAG: SMP-30/gluconolactonase/LRE family protein [Ruminococcaceae bacterium]|nr:SMP-30/gluconolactonase/LRE family protein [Oscillospiraceae bacterium]